jgi:hypothetical protein
MVLLPQIEVSGIMVVLDKSCRQFRGKVAGRISLQTKITGFGKPEPVLFLAIGNQQMAVAGATGSRSCIDRISNFKFKNLFPICVHLRKSAAKSF